MTVLDVCSAPGGKSFAAAIMMGNSGCIRSFDIHENKLSLIRSGASRLGLDIISVSAGDARQFDAQLSEIADVVLADVPCSGIGVIRKKPEIRYKSEDEIGALPQIQLDILKNSSRYVKPGGVLLYSTCTILREENQNVITEFLNQNDNFELEAFELPEPFGRCDGMATILPYVGNTDGFFICKLRRTK
jgi:16S rRNA (cytosine967-C5)-methyltransferase